MAKQELKLYTLDEINELGKWFDTIKLPESLQLDKATYIPDVRETLNCVIAQAQINCGNPKMQGAVFLLERIKAKLEETQK